MKFLQHLVSYLAFLFCTVGLSAASTCNHGKLLTIGVLPKCSCVHGYKGFDCSERIKACEGNPCRNAGVCVDNYDSTFTCICVGSPPTHEGILCEREVKVQLACDSTPCKNGEVCSNEADGKFKCTCSEDYRGPECGERAINIDALATSTVLKDNQTWIEQLEHWLPSDQTGVMKLCYKSPSENGQSASEFHSLCDNKGPTVVLVQSGKYVFGGYASKSWGGPTGYVSANGSFIFSFVNKDGLKPFKSPIYRNFDKALRMDPDRLVIFGNGYDLDIPDHSRVPYAYLGSTYKLPPGYDFPSWSSKVLLAGVPFFDATKLEVYYFD